MSKPLYKTTIVIWTEDDPANYELDDLARRAIEDDAYCSQAKHIFIKDPKNDPDWDGTEFFEDPDCPPDEYVDNEPTEGC